MSTVVDAVLVHTRPTSGLSDAPARIALLGVGNVGGALAALVHRPPLSERFTVVSGLVRDAGRERPLVSHLRFITSVRHALDNGPDLVIEALGGLEPARTLVLSAIERQIPVVTANKSLLAAHGEELFDAASNAGVPIRYEAAVLAGVPFLGTFAGRPLARGITGLCGIVNGTTNYMLSKMADERMDFATALDDAQRLGYAEPDPANDVGGVDAAEKLCVLVRHFNDWNVVPSQIATDGIAAIETRDLQAAAELDGVVKPVVYADWRDGTLAAFAGPAFVRSSHPLAQINGVQNAVLLRNQTHGELLFAGPGAGPVVTAATLLDDAAEILETSGRENRTSHRRAWRRGNPVVPESGWFVRVSGERLPEATQVADLLSSYGVWLQRTSDRPGDQRWFLTHRCEQSRLVSALHTLEKASTCRTLAVRVLES